MNTSEINAGQLFVFSAPSGAGKSTLISALRSEIPELKYSVSHTTRAPRPGETDGVDYFFIDHEAFESRIEKGVWLEWAKVHDNYYGTSSEFISETLLAGQHIVLDIDVQGADQVKKRFPDCIRIFIEPPSMAVLKQRLKSRGTDAADVIETRMNNAADEMAHKDQYNHTILNDDLDTAINELTQIVRRYI